MSSKGVRIFYWPDGTWIYASDYGEEVDKWRGQDYGEVFTDWSTEPEDEDIQKLVDLLVDAWGPSNA